MDFSTNLEKTLLKLEHSKDNGYQVYREFVKYRDPHYEGEVHRLQMAMQDFPRWKKRFFTKDYGTYKGTWFEMMLYLWLKPYGTVQIEPQIPCDKRKIPLKPDFLLLRDAQQIIIEATALLDTGQYRDIEEDAYYIPDDDRLPREKLHEKVLKYNVYESFGYPFVIAILLNRSWIDKYDMMETLNGDIIYPLENWRVHRTLFVKNEKSIFGSEDCMFLSGVLVCEEKYNFSAKGTEIVVHYFPNPDAQFPLEKWFSPLEISIRSGGYGAE